jgi:beta-glucanase (GH16 family)
MGSKLVAVQTIIRKGGGARRRRCPYARRGLLLEELEPRWVPSGTPIFNDDFNLPAGSQPSTSTWTAFNTRDPNNTNVVYTNTTSTLQIVNDSGALDGKAVALSLMPDAKTSGQYDSAEIRTKVDPVAGNLLYGELDVRAKIPGGPNGQGDGIWPAIWMLGSNDSATGWPSCGEMDIMENKGSTPGEIQGTIHGPGYQSTGVTTKYDLPTGQVFYSSYHIFSVIWAPDLVEFAVDGTVYATLTPSRLPTGGIWEFNHPFYIILNVAEGGPFAGPPNANSTYPQTMDVDYVRAYAETPPVLDFAAQPASFTTNVGTAVIAGITDPTNTVKVNGTQLPAGSVNASGVFTYTVTLAPGANSLVVAITNSSGKAVTTTTKTVVYSASFSTSAQNLLYVDVVSSTLDGTLVEDVAAGELLGILPGEHVLGLSPDGKEVYMDNGNVVSTDSNQTLRALPVSTPIPANGFLVSPTGDRIYAGNQIVDVQSNTLLPPLPDSITTGTSYNSAPIPGGPAISADGSVIYAYSSATATVLAINTRADVITDTGIGTGGKYLSDIALSPNGKQVLLSEYGSAAGSLATYDANNYQLLGTVSGLGDYVGDIGFLDNGLAVVGSAGNPSLKGGAITVVNLASQQIVQQIPIMLAANVTTSANLSNVFVSTGTADATGSRFGVDNFAVGPGGQLTLANTFFLGINQYVAGMGTADEQIRGVVVKQGPPANQLIVSAPRSATAGVPFNVTVTAQNSSGQLAGGFTGTVTLTSSDGAFPPTTLALSAGTATIPITLTHGGNQTITATFPGLSAGTGTLTINAGAFSQFLVTVPNSSAIQAGSNFLLSVQAADQYGNPITQYSGPAGVTATVSPASADSNFPATLSMGSNGVGLFLGNQQRVGTYTITVASGSFTGSAPSVSVVPATPVKLAFATQPAGTPTGVTLPALTVGVFDGFGNLVTSDSSDSVTVGIASGPGGFLPGSTTTAMVQNGIASFTNLTLVVPGAYTLSAVVPGLLTGPNSASFTVMPLQVVPGSLVSTPTGFSLALDAPFLVNSSTPILFGAGMGATGPVPSLTLTQTSDAGGHAVNVPIVGSLVPDSAGNRLTFVATDTALQANNGSPVLPDGTYTLTLHGSPAGNGLLALNRGGGFLDGLGTSTPGSGDYTATFTVGVAAAHDDVVWAPATADGPGEALSAPGQNQLGGGYPIYLSDTTGGVTDVQLTLNYNPALLNVTSVSGVGLSLLASSTPGQAVLHYSGSALPAGTKKPIGFITAAVPSGTAVSPMPYKAVDFLHLSDITLNSGAVPAVGGDAVHLVAYVDDADGNGSYSSNDAVLVTRVVLQADLGFTAYPRIDPVIVADTDGAGFIPADAALQANEASVGLPTANLPIPPIPSGVVFQATVMHRPSSLAPRSSLLARDALVAAQGQDAVGVPSGRAQVRRIADPLLAVDDELVLIDAARQRAREAIEAVFVRALHR